MRGTGDGCIALLLAVAALVAVYRHPQAIGGVAEQAPTSGTTSPPFPPAAVAAATRAARTIVHGKKIGGRCDFLGVVTGGPADALTAALKPFESAADVDVNYEATFSQQSILQTRIQAGNPPDVVFSAYPRQLVNLAKAGKLVPLNNVVNMQAVRKQYPKPLLDLGSCGRQAVCVLLHRQLPRARVVQHDEIHGPARSDMGTVAGMDEAKCTAGQAAVVPRNREWRRDRLAGCQRAPRRALCPPLRSEARGAVGSWQAQVDVAPGEMGMAAGRRDLHRSEDGHRRGARSREHELPRSRKRHVHQSAELLPALTGAVVRLFCRGRSFRERALPASATSGSPASRRPSRTSRWSMETRSPCFEIARRRGPSSRTWRRLEFATLLAASGQFFVPNTAVATSIYPTPAARGLVQRLVKSKAAKSSTILLPSVMFKVPVTNQFFKDLTSYLQNPDKLDTYLKDMDAVEKRSR